MTELREQVEVLAAYERGEISKRDLLVRMGDVKDVDAELARIEVERVLDAVERLYGGIARGEVEQAVKDGPDRKVTVICRRCDPPVYMHPDQLDAHNEESHAAQ